MLEAVSGGASCDVHAQLQKVLPRARRLARSTLAHANVLDLYSITTAAVRRFAAARAAAALRVAPLYAARRAVQPRPLTCCRVPAATAT
eukprot:5082410-Prymnesium_polylepis.2